MIDLTPQQTFPTFLNVGTKTAWTALNKKANTLLGFPDDELASNYSNSIVDINGDYWIIINPEIVSLFTEEQLKSSVQFEEIKLPENKI